MDQKQPLIQQKQPPLVELCLSLAATSGSGNATPALKRPLLVRPRYPSSTSPSSPPPSAPSEAAAAQSLPPTTQIEVFGLPPNLDEASTSSIFQQFGPVSSVKLFASSAEYSKPYVIGGLLPLNPKTLNPFLPLSAIIEFADAKGVKKVTKAGAVLGSKKVPTALRSEGDGGDSTEGEKKTKMMTSASPADVVFRLRTKAEGAAEGGKEQPREPGLKGWVENYRRMRPGLAVLQKMVDDDAAKYEEEQERARLEREERAAREHEEGGWTLVVGKKGRKKSTDETTGVAVGAISAEVAARMAKKALKKQEQQKAADFYRFQNREARRNELLELRERFEEDKKRIAQMREARKFRPY